MKIIRDSILFVFPVLEAQGHSFMGAALSIIPYFIITLIPIIWIKSKYIKKILNESSSIILLVSLSHIVSVIINVFLAGLFTVVIFKILPNQLPYDDKFVLLSARLYYALTGSHFLLLDIKYFWWQWPVNTVLYLIPCFCVSYWNDFLAIYIHMKKTNIDVKTIKHTAWHSNLRSYLLIGVLPVAYFFVQLLTHW
jgi:hypothetical protein